MWSGRSRVRTPSLTPFFLNFLAHNILPQFPFHPTKTSQKIASILINVLNARLNRIAQSETSGLILMDIHMLGMDCLTAFKKLQTMNETKNIPVIALTADAMDSDIKKALDIGFKDYINKPIDVPKFLTMIDEFFKLREHGN